MNFYEANEKFKLISPQYENIKKINNIFLNCYFDTKNLETEFQNLIDDKTTDFSRYTFFYAMLLNSGLREGFN